METLRRRGIWRSGVVRGVIAPPLGSLKSSLSGALGISNADLVIPRGKMAFGERIR